ncbi:MAG: hypothetical protein EPO52_04450 [Herbiconiux sp.]|uniref:DUF5684 domain-containing protein n=1 Tax=Herbiconiux sp. TaxID=1871186 RepID=UPI0011F9D93B|nr:DUF5684 domain-containing protein [Herbiconiux sp.]TAJ49525.1 MAG: hypothetical protein EPO52_04450 [Herbiconiux sp.]
MTPDAQSALAVQIIVGVLVLTYGLVILVIAASWVVMGFALMSLYRKVGVKPWIAWVPYYRTWVWLKLGGQPGWLALLSLLGLGFVASIFLIIGMSRIGQSFRKDAGFLVLGIFLPYVWAFILGGRTSVYEPGLLAWYGQPAPLVGYGSVVADFATDLTAPGWQSPAQAG